MNYLVTLTGYLLLVASVAISISVFRHDIWRERIALEAPQAAPKRIAPEIHVLTAMVAGFGVGVALANELHQPVSSSPTKEDVAIQLQSD